MELCFALYERFCVYASPIQEQFVFDIRSTYFFLLVRYIRNIVSVQVQYTRALCLCFYSLGMCFLFLQVQYVRNVLVSIQLQIKRIVCCFCSLGMRLLLTLVQYIMYVFVSIQV